MKRARLLAVMMIAVIPCSGGDGLNAGEPPTVSDVQSGNAATNQIIPEPADWEQGFPIPKGARSNDSLGGATSLGPGRNYTLKVYDVEFGMEAMTAFYRRHLPEAKRVSEGREVRFSTPRGYVRLARFSKGTRITLVVGPR